MKETAPSQAYNYINIISLLHRVGNSEAKESLCETSPLCNKTVFSQYYTFTNHINYNLGSRQVFQIVTPKLLLEIGETA